jgi:hypothetical protein
MRAWYGYTSRATFYAEPAHSEKSSPTLLLSMVSLVSIRATLRLTHVASTPRLLASAVTESRSPTLGDN